MPQGGAASMTLDVPAIRAAYPALADGYAYLDGAAGTQVPGSVIDAIGDAYRSGLGNAGGVFPASIRSTTVTEQCRRAVADLVGGVAEGVILGPNMTTLTYRLAGTLARSWGPGDEVVVSRLDHDANVRPWVQAAARAGATVRWAEVELPAGDRRQQRARHPPRRGRDHRQGARRGRAQLRGRGARDAARAHRRGGAGRRFLRDQRLQVVGAARGSRHRRPRAARVAAPGQAGAGPGHGARAVRAGHAPVRRSGRGHGGGRASGLAGRARGRDPPGAGAGL